MMRRPRSRARGFTLVEAIVVMVIIGIVAAMVAVFIRAPVMGYRDSVDRAEITDQADLALRRIARDIRLALPNSVRVSDNGAANGSRPNSALEFLQTKSGARYLADDDGVPNLPTLSFDDQSQAAATNVPFTVFAPPAMFRQQVAQGDWVVVYNLGEGFEPANAYRVPAAGQPGNIARIAAAPTYTDNTPIGPVGTVVLAGNPFAAQAASQTSPSMPSPTYSFQVVGGAVSYYCAAQPDGTLALWRAWGYGINAAQSVPGAGARAVLASRLTTCDGIFSYGSAATQRSGLVLLSLSLKGRYPDSPAIRLVHQVHVDNTP